MVPAPGSDRGVARDLGARHTDTLGQQLAQPREQSAGAPPSPALGRAAKGKPRAIVLGMTPGTPCTSPERARATVLVQVLVQVTYTRFLAKVVY